MAEKTKKLTPKRMAIFSAVVSLVAFLYKFGLGIISYSIILMVASISTLLVFICKVIFVRNMEATRDKKKRAYFLMLVLALSFGILFLLFSVLQVGGIEIKKTNNFDGWLAYLFIAFVILMFLLSIIKLRGALGKDDIMVIGLKEMTFVSALADAVIIEEFLYRVLISYIVDAINFPILSQVVYYTNSYFPLLTAIFMICVPAVFMFKRFRHYEVEA